MSAEPTKTSPAYSLGMAAITEDVQAIVRQANLGQNVIACAYRVLVTDEGEQIVDLVLVINATEWDDLAVSICEEASDKLAEAARGTQHALGFFCRTSAEHRERTEAEAGLWTPVEVGVAC